MDDSLDATYAPQSPDLSAPDSHEPEPLHPQHQQYRGSVSHTLTPFTPTDRRNPFASAGSPFAAGQQGSYFPPQPYGQPVQQFAGFKQDIFASKRESNGAAGDDGDWDPMAPGTRKKVKTEMKEEYGEYGNGAPMADVPAAEVKTKFPVARIKRIMQSDEDVGKVAQVTPVVVSKALELFMIDLVTSAATEAKSRSSKRVTAAHLKQAVMTNEKYKDWLADIVSKAPDAPAGAGGGRATQGDDSDEWGNEGKKKRGGGRKKKKEED